VGCVGVAALPVDLMFLRMIRMVRLLRILRIARTLHSFQALYIMVTSIKGSLDALLWSAALLFTIETVMALMLTTWLEGYILDEEQPEELRWKVFMYFGTFTKATLSMFELALANWIPVSRTLTEHVSEWYLIFVLGHKFIVGFAVVVVLTGIFLQETFKVAMEDDVVMTTKRAIAGKIHKAKMEKMFRNADVDFSGSLQEDELSDIISNQSMRMWLAAMGLQVSDSATLFRVLDTDGDQGISIEELATGVARLKGSARSIDVAVMLFDQRQLHVELESIRSQNRQLLACLSEGRGPDAGGAPATSPAPPLHNGDGPGVLTRSPSLR